jgi:hypothetical protein
MCVSRSWPVFLTSAVVGGEWSASHPCRFTPGQRAPGNYWIWGWVGPRTSLDDVKWRQILFLPELEFRPLCCPARSQSLYRPLYPGSRMGRWEMSTKYYRKICREETNWEKKGWMGRKLMFHKNVGIYLTTRRHVPGDRDLHIHHGDSPEPNFEPCYVLFVVVLKLLLECV